MRLFVTESVASLAKKRGTIHVARAIPNTEICWFWKDDIYARAQRRNVLKAVRYMKRSLFEIIAEMLQVGKHGAKKTRIMYSCNLSYRMTEKFLTYLLEADLLREGNSFHTTEKGLQFLRAYQTLELLLSSKIQTFIKRG